MTGALPHLIPTSLQRVRCFLNTQGGIKVKPWSSVDETLDAFFGMLVSNHNNEPFWQGLETLLTDLSKDMKRRIEARTGEIIDNEVLNPERYHELIHEIRKAMVGQRKGRGGFRKLGSMLSAPAFGVLMLLGGAASLGCTSQAPMENKDIEVQTDVDGGADVDSTDTFDTDPGSDSDSATSENGNDGGMETDDTSEDKTLEEIVLSTVSDEGEQTEILDCIDALHDSWRTGLEELFSNKESNDISHYLEDCLLRGEGPNGGWCQNPEQAGEYDLDTFLNNCAVLVYLGVRFE